MTTAPCRWKQTNVTENWRKNNAAAYETINDVEYEKEICEREKKRATLDIRFTKTKS